MALLAACGGTDEGPSGPATVAEESLVGEISAGAGPTPIPVTPTPIPTATPEETALYGSAWSGSYTLGKVTRGIVVEFTEPRLTGDPTRGQLRRRDEGTMNLAGTKKLMDLSFVKVGTSTVTFRVMELRAQFNGLVEGDKITGDITIGEVLKQQGTFEVHSTPK